MDFLLDQSGGDKKTIETIMSEKAVFPFSAEGRTLAYLLVTKTITYEKYEELLTKDWQTGFTAQK